MTSVFLSYARLDEDSDAEVEDFRRRLEAELRLDDRSSSVFRDAHSIPVGAEWRDAIGVALEKATAFVPLLSGAFFSSAWCTAEAERWFALRGGDPRRRLAPVLWNPVPSSVTSSLWVKLQVFQRLDWSQLRGCPWSDGHQTRLCQLAQALLREEATTPQRISPDLRKALVRALWQHLSVPEMESLMLGLGDFEPAGAAPPHLVANRVIEVFAASGRVDSSLFRRLHALRPGQSAVWRELSRKLESGG